MARISLDPPRSLLQRAATWYAKRWTGATMDPLNALAHNPKVLLADMLFEWRVGSWNALDPLLKHLAVMTASARIGCSWCVDFGYWEAAELGLPEAKVRAANDWRQHRGEFTGPELLVLEYAEAMTATPPEVTDELSARLLAVLGEAALVELTAIVAVENLRSRTNSALGLTGQGFSDSCAARPATVS